MGCLRLASKSRQIFIFSRNFASRRRRREPKVNLKRYDNVYAISYREPPKQIFTEAMGALRAYNISLDGITDQIVELYVRVDMGEKTKQKINPFHGLMLLPKPYGVERKVLVFARGEAAEAARRAGGNFVGEEELIQQVADGEVTDFDQCLCTLEFLNKMKPLQKILREKMPTTRRGTASDNIAAAIDAYKKGHPYRCDREGIVNIGVGKLSFTDSEVRVNASAVLSTLATHGTVTKGKFFRELVISSERGPSYPLEIAEWVS
ncbi:uncharacterized protein LOC113669810 [Pocillopora damicornis]|uniref:uncharacterized protein LOC113669810 n=1 Tax=Pocillopora damicornis TaxID=46731 RepID=UPI000F54FA71|nr:uncharacterized protein LOC113669810 [Pocillopora damicornis]